MPFVTCFFSQGFNCFSQSLNFLDAESHAGGNGFDRDSCREEFSRAVNRFYTLASCLTPRFAVGDPVLVVGLHFGLVVHFREHVPDVLKFRFRREVLHLAGPAQFLRELVVENLLRDVALPLLRVLEHVACPVKPSVEFLLALEESPQFHKNTNNCVRSKLPGSFFRHLVV